MEKAEFNDIVEMILRDTGCNFSLTEEKDALFNMAVERRDTFVVLPTGSGKSVVLQLLPAVMQRLRPHLQPIVVLVCLLVSLLN